MTSPPNQPSILFEMYWSAETRKRLGLDGPGMRILPTDEPYDRVKIPGVEMTMDELRALLQRFVDEERKTQPAAALRRVAERLHAKATAFEQATMHDDMFTRSVLRDVVDALKEEAEELRR